MSFVMPVSSGITPACAGNSWRSGFQPVSAWDHPRLRGEQYDARWDRYSKWGSPPLARGTASRPPPYRLPQGITPACAGNSSMPSISGAIMWDHPRLRGEQDRHNCSAYFAMGSPPLARGTVGVQRPVWWGRRITPACAGNSCHAVSLDTGGRDHPRLRGEQGRRYRL